MTDRMEIIHWLIADGLVDRCIHYQTRKADRYLVDELRQECWLWLMGYDGAKLADAYENRHMNALISRWISNQFHSANSPFYKRYRKIQGLEDEITDGVRNLPE